MIINFAFELFFSLFGNTRSSASRDAYRDNCTIFCHFFFLLLFFERERLFSMERIFRVDRWNDERILFVFLGV